MTVDTTRVLSAVRNELVAAGIVRRPNDSGTLPPLHVEPKGGAPAPGERRDGAAEQETAGNVVASIRLSSEIPGSPADAFRRRVIVDVIYRSASTTAAPSPNAALQRARLLHEEIVRHLVDANAYRMGQTLDAGGPAALSMLSAAVFGGLSPLDDGADGPRTDMAKLAFEVLAN